MPLNDFRSVFLPYCIKHLGNGRYVVLNREYKPIGFNDRNAWAEYEDYPIVCTIDKLTAARIEKVSVDPSTLPANIYLYDDSCVPTKSAANMRAYMERLKVLAPLFVKPAPR